MRWQTAAPFALLLAVALPGQQSETEREMELQARKMRELVRDGTKLIRTHARVQVRLKNGNRMRGIVKDSNLVERVDGYRFVQAEISQPGAGIRVWYHDNKNSYVFLPFLDIAEYKVQERLTTEQLLAIEEAVVAEERIQAEEKARQEAAEKQAGEGEPTDPQKKGPEENGKSGESKPGETKPPAGETGAVTPKVPVDDGKLLELLREFPPADGWGEERRALIVQRRVAVNIAPTAQEQRFLDVFADWEKAVTRFVGTSRPSQPVEAGRNGRRR